MSKIYLAECSTRSFDFQAVGLDREQATQAMHNGLRQHAHSHELGQAWSKEQDFNVHIMEPGQCYRDSWPCGEPATTQMPSHDLLQALAAHPRWHLDCEVLKFGRPGKWRVWSLKGNQERSTDVRTHGEGDTPAEAIIAAIASTR